MPGGVPMKSAFLLMMIVMSLWNNHGEEQQVSASSRFIFEGQEYDLEEAGFPAGTRVERIRGWYINGYHFISKDIKHKGAVVVFGGSEGSCDLTKSLTLAYEGYEVYAMYFYGQENQQKKIERIPLEFFAELYLYIQQTARSSKPLTIHGTSKGTELALLLASYFPDQVDHLILYAPVAYVFQGNTENHHSPWTFQGKELPFISLDSEVLKNMEMIARRNRQRLHSTKLFQYALEHDENKDKARIDLGKIRAKMLLFAGEMDEKCPAADMGREIKANYNGECELVIFERAGHVFTDMTVYRGYWEVGGDPEANVQAGIESRRILFEKLAEWTK